MRFDSFGRMKSMVYPDGEAVEYTYDEGGLLQRATGTRGAQSFTYLGHLGYDEFGQRIMMRLGNEAETSYSYDPQTRRLSALR